ncbi:glycosyltransferase, partial [Parabacteroides sp.]
ECKEYVKGSGLEDMVEFRTEIDHRLLVDFYNSLDLFVLPTMFEGFGCVLTEAYACGVPFMVCENQGAAECIEPTEMDRWTFPINDHEKLAQLITNFYWYRYEQHLCVPIDINQLVRDFLEEIFNEQKMIS